MLVVVQVAKILPMRKVAMFAYCILGFSKSAKCDKSASVSKAIPLMTRVIQTVARRPSFSQPM